MFSSESTERLAFISRQLSYLLAEQQLEPALKRLSEASPPQYSQDIEYLRRLLAGLPEDGRTPGPNPYRAMAKLLPAVPASKGAFFREFVEYVQENKIVFATYWAGVVSLIGYLAAVSLVALVVAIVFGVFVMPTFDDMFRSHGSALPEFTQAVLAFGEAGIPLFAAMLALVAGLVAFFATQFHRRIRQLRPLPRWPTWAPVIGKLAGLYNLGLFLNYARMLGRSGTDKDRAVREAAAAANQTGSLSYESLSEGDFAQTSVLAELGVAARLGHFDSEINYQCEQHLGQLSLALVEARDKFSLILKTALYVFVAALLVAMYLPIFKMGSVI